MVACITKSSMGFLVFIATTFIGVGLSQPNIGSSSTGFTTQSTTSSSSSGFQQQTTKLSPNDCTFFSSSSPCNVPQRAFEQFCLSNGSIIVGFCWANEFFCDNRNPHTEIVLSPLSSCSLSSTLSHGMFPGAGAGSISFKTGTTDKYENHYKRNAAHSNLHSTLQFLVLTLVFACAADFMY